MSIQYPDLFTTDTKNAVRFWRLEQDGCRYRTVSGIVGGKEVTSGWTTCVPKNTGRANATTAEEQCVAEIVAEYKKKRDRKYYDNIAEVGTHKYFQPMLAETYNKDKFRVPSVAFSQPKLDGLRCIAKADGLWSRQGKPFSVPHVWEALRPLFVCRPHLVLDGELYNHELKDDFNEIVSLVKRLDRTPEQAEKCERLVQYHVYDMPSVPGTFETRHDAILGLALQQPVVVVRTSMISSQREIDELYDDYVEDGYEGQIIRLLTPYEHKRSKGLLKRKEFLDDEFRLVRVEEGNGNWAGYAKRAVFLLPDGREFGAGIKGTQTQMRDLLENWGKYGAATVRFFALTPDGIPRFPVAVAWHENVDKRD